MKIKILFFFFLSGLFFCNSSNGNDMTKLRQPVNKKATQETVALYNRLFLLLEKGIMLSHQDALAYGHSWYKEDGRSDVKDITGDYPAVIGAELGDIELSVDHSLDSVYFSDIKRYTRETYERGGICTFSWHANNIVTGKNAWDCDREDVVKSVLPNGNNHIKYLSWLNKLAEFFLDLKTKDGKLIPVVFRMFHEQTRDWFWWGNKQCTPEEYKQLWTMTEDYLTKLGVNNLLYAYSPTDTRDENHFLERYPGDKYVDIVAFDHYVPGERGEKEVKDYVNVMDHNLKIITEYAKKANKIPTISETGMEGVVDSLFFTKTIYPLISKYKVSWILFWRNAWNKPTHFYLPYPGHPAAKDLVDFVSKPDILLNKDINNF